MWQCGLVEVEVAGVVPVASREMGVVERVRRIGRVRRDDGFRDAFRRQDRQIMIVMLKFAGLDTGLVVEAVAILETFLMRWPDEAKSAVNIKYATARALEQQHSYNSLLGMIKSRFRRKRN